MTTDGVRFGSDRVDSTGAEEASLLPVILFLCCLFLWWMGEALGAGCAIYLIGTGVPVLALIYSTLECDGGFYAKRCSGDEQLWPHYLFYIEFLEYFRIY